MKNYFLSATCALLKIAGFMLGLLSVSTNSISNGEFGPISCIAVLLFGAGHIIEMISSSNDIGKQ